MKIMQTLFVVNGAWNSVTVTVDKSAAVAPTFEEAFMLAHRDATGSEPTGDVISLAVGTITARLRKLSPDQAKVEVSPHPSRGRDVYDCYPFQDP